MNTNVKEKNCSGKKETKPDQSETKRTPIYGPLLPTFALKRRAYLEEQYEKYGIKKRKTATLR